MSTYICIKKNDIINICALLFLFIIWPFLSLLLSLYRYNKVESKIIFVLFTALYGYSIIANSEELDLYRYLYWIEYFHYDLLNWSDFAMMVVAVNASEGVSMDLYRDVMAFLVSRFTSEGHVLMLFFGFVFGLAYVKTLTLLFSVYNRWSVWGGIILFAYSFAFSLDWLGGVRFGTAAYVFLIGILYHIRGSKKAYIYFLLSTSIHLGFAVGFFIYFIYKYLYQHTKHINTIVIISFFFSFIFQMLVVLVANYFGGRIAETMSSYTSTDFLQYASDGGIPWYSKIHNTLFVLFVYIFLFILNWKRSFCESNNSNKAFVWLISSLITVNLFAFSPVFSQRFIILSFALFFIYFYFLYANNEHNIKLKKYILYALAFYTLHVINAIRYIFEYTTPQFYSPLLSNVITSKGVVTMWSYLFGS